MTTKVSKMPWDSIFLDSNSIGICLDDFAQDILDHIAPNRASHIHLVFHISLFEPFTSDHTLRLKLF